MCWPISTGSGEIQNSIVYMATKYEKVAIEEGSECLLLGSRRHSLRYELDKPCLAQRVRSSCHSKRELKTCSVRALVRLPLSRDLD